MSDNARADVPTGLDCRQRQLVRQHADIIAGIPRGRFITAENGDRDDIPHADIPRGVLKKLRGAGIIKRAGTLRQSERCANSRGRIWHIPADAHEQATQYDKETPSPCGCGHSGIRNLGDDTYTCCDDDCDVRVTREEVTHG